jgi:hypothetical protein
LTAAEALLWHEFMDKVSQLSADYRRKQVKKFGVAFIQG